MEDLKTMWLITPPVDVLGCMKLPYMAGARGGHKDIHLGRVEIRMESPGWLLWEHWFVSKGFE